MVSGHGPGVECRVARSEVEVAAARELVFRSFGPSYFEVRLAKELDARIVPGDHEPRNYVVALLDGAVVGMLRYYGREIVIAGVRAQFATLAEFCVTPEAARRFVGLSLLSHSLACITERGFSVCWGSARRVMDDYYHRAGFAGVGSYCRVVIEKVRGTSGDDAVALRPFNPEHLGIYETAHAVTYGRTWGMLPRSEQRWRLIGARAGQGHGPRFAECETARGVVGYVIWTDDAVLEVAGVDNSLSLHHVVAALQPSAGPASMRLAMPLDHPNLTQLSRDHVTLTQRRVPDAGLIAKVLNLDAVLALIRATALHRWSEAQLPSVQLAHSGVVVDWRPSESHLTIESDATAAADQFLLWLLFQGIGPLDAGFGSAWARYFPKQYFAPTAVDGA